MVTVNEMREALITEKVSARSAEQLRAPESDPRQLSLFPRGDV